MEPDGPQAAASSDHSGYRLGVDIGGTFTDLMLVNEATGALTVGKTLTTPGAPSDAIERGLRELLDTAGVAASRLRHVIHGTTLVTNAIIERKGARTALITTRGFRDAYEIGREQRYDLYDLFLEMPRPLVPRHLRLEVDERVYANGAVAEPLDLEGCARLAVELRDKGVEAIGVCFLHSYANPRHERALADLIREIAPEVRVSISSEVSPEIREYERTSTTLANVYAQELVENYLDDLARRLRGLGFEGQLLIMLSSGGVATVDTARRYPVRLLESGPAAGALATAHLGRLAGFQDLLAFDMGGTTAKLCVIAGGEPQVATTFEVDRAYRFKKGSGLPISTPVIELVEIGAGGGSIARVDALGLLKVGPESAGSEPGPACYGRGGAEPTVTDADLLLGYLDPAFFLGGRMTLDSSAAETAIRSKIAEPLGMSVVEAAWGIHQIVNESMATAARVHAIERGKDPRTFPLFAFGGAGPGHGYGVARILHSPLFLTPFGAGVASSLGLLVAPLAFDFVRTFYGRLDGLDWEAINDIYADLQHQGQRLLHDSGVPDMDMTFVRQADLRYAGQGHEVRVAMPAGRLGPGRIAEIASAFEAEYRTLYGRTGPEVGLEGVSWRVIAAGPRPELRPAADEISSGERSPLKGYRPVYFGEWGEHRPTPVYDRYVLAAGYELDGPAIIEERESTLVVGPGARISVDAWRNVRVELKA